MTDERQHEVRFAVGFRHPLDFLTVSEEQQTELNDFTKTAINMNVQKPRIVFACESLVKGNGGVSRVDQLITEVLREEEVAGRLNVEHLVFLDSGAGQSSLPGRQQYFNGSRLKFTLGVWQAVLKPGFFIYDLAYLARVHPALLGLDRRRLVFSHGIEVWEKCRPSWVRACRRADLLVSNSDYTRKRADSLHGVFERAQVCWLGTEPNSQKLTRNTSAKERRVLIVGRMQAGKGFGYKGHRELILEWPKIVATVGDVTLEIVGDGNLRPELQQLAEEIGVRKYVKFYGFVTDSELNAAYERATIFAMPSRGEGFGLVYIEAMRHGLPVVASIHDAATEVVLDGRTGLLANLDNPHDLAEKLILLLRNRDLAWRMGNAGQERWQEHFTYAAFSNRFRALLGELISTPQQSRVG